MLRGSRSKALISAGLACHLLALGAARARAQTGAAETSLGPLRFRFECPTLTRDSELRASFEARALVELSLGSPQPGTLSVQCAEERARVTWQPNGAQAFSRDVAVPAQDPQRLVETLVSTVWELADATRRPAPPTPAPPVAKLPTPPKPPPASWRMGFAMGGTTEPWSDAWMAGPHAGFAATSASGFGIEVHAGSRFATARLRSVRFQTYDLALGANYALSGLPLEIGSICYLSLLSAESSRADVTTTANAFAAELRVALRSRLDTDWGFVRLGPSLGLYAARPRITLDGDKVTDAPTWTGTLDLDLALLPF